MADPPPGGRVNNPHLPAYLLLPNVGQGDVGLALPPVVAPRPPLDAGVGARPPPAALSSLARDGPALARARGLLTRMSTYHM